MSRQAGQQSGGRIWRPRSTSCYKRCVCTGMLHILYQHLLLLLRLQLEEINDKLSSLSNDPDNPPSTSMLRAIQRHREVYQDYSRELRRTKVGSLWTYV